MNVSRLHMLKSAQIGLVGLFTGFVVAVSGCSDLDGTNDLRISLSCNNYCERAKECDDSVDVAECEANCEDAANDCMADEQEMALDELDNCASESCDDFGTCTVGAGLECAFGW